MLKYIAIAEAIVQRRRFVYIFCFHSFEKLCSSLNVWGSWLGPHVLAHFISLRPRVSAKATIFVRCFRRALTEDYSIFGVLLLVS